MSNTPHKTTWADVGKLYWQIIRGLWDCVALVGLTALIATLSDDTFARVIENLRPKEVVFNIYAEDTEETLSAIEQQIARMNNAGRN